MKHLPVLLILTLAACGGGDSGADTLTRGGLVAEKIGDIPGPGACGVPNAYRVTEAAGVKLSQAATIRRATAERLDGWLRNHAIPIIGNKGGGLVGIQVPAHYACRTRNHQPGAKLSEHAKGNAIDISAFLLADGSRIEVTEWRGANGRVLKQLHASACGPFGTVLGPDSDRFHHNHFHLDIADYRGGSYCR
ncbi:MAG: extensin-like domain-containing protein [Paracoccaceae bacterium]